MSKWTYGILVCGIFVAALFFRAYQITKIPLSPYWEEVALGYDAYSILKTGKDHHGQPWPIVAFESFGDWKPTGYFYAVVPFIQFFGLNVLAVRLPSVISGLAIVLGMGALAFIVSESLTPIHRKTISLIAMAITAISPWALLFSRGGWEVNLATALMLWGAILGLLSHQNKQPTWKNIALLTTSAFLLVLSMYTYHAARLTAPFLGAGIGLLYFFGTHSTRVTQRLLYLVIVGLLALFLLTPLLLSLGSKQTQQRFAETSILADLSLIEESNNLKAAAGNTFIARLIYHRYLLFAREIAVSYVAHFRSDFLFTAGDTNPRHSVRFFGQLYHIEAIFLLLGTYYFFKKWTRYHAFLLLWLLIGIIPAALTNASPHALRILPTLPVWLILITNGIYQLGHNSYSKNQKYLFPLFISLLFGVYLLEFASFWRYYTKVYPIAYANEWQYGYEQLVDNLAARQAHYDQVYVTQNYGRPTMYYWFYTQTDPMSVQANQSSARTDQGEIITYEKLRFVYSVKEVESAPALVASTHEGLLYLTDRYRIHVFEKIYNPSGELLWVIYEIR